MKNKKRDPEREAHTSVRLCNSCAILQKTWYPYCGRLFWRCSQFCGILFFLIISAFHDNKEPCCSDRGKTTMLALSLACFHSRCWLDCNHTVQLFQYRPDILGETDLVHSYQAKRRLSQGKGEQFKCSPIPCTCVVKYITAQENCQPVSKWINLSDTDPGTHTHKSTHAWNSNKYLFTRWWKSL